MSSNALRSVVESVMYHRAISSTDSILARDPSVAMHTARLLTDLGIVGPSNGRGRHDVYVGAARQWLAADDLARERDAEQARQDEAAAALRNELAQLQVAHDQAVADLAAEKSSGAVVRRHARLAWIIAAVLAITTLIATGI